MDIQCEMADNCETPVTHIGNKGYVYCTSHAIIRRPWERTRKMTAVELRTVKAGKPITKY